MGGKRSSSSCNTCWRKVWTGCYLFTWLLVIVGLLLCHLAIAKMVPAMRDLPGNLKEGFYGVFGFDTLAADSKKIQDACVEAMEMCGANPTNNVNCNSYSGGSSQRRSTTTTQKDKIVAAFDVGSLAKIQKIGFDKYFGKKELKETADNLKKIRDKVDAMSTNNEYCQATNTGYCNMYKNAKKINSGTAEVRKQIDAMINNEWVVAYTENIDKLNGAHALPYVWVIAMVLFFIFWKKYAACCCCDGGGCIGCIVLVFHIILFLLSLVFSSIFAGIGLYVEHAADRYVIPGGMFKGEPTLKDLLDHVEAAYPAFWALVFDPLLKPCKLFSNVMVLFSAFCLIIVLYEVCLCIRRPYTDKDGDK